MTDRRAQGDRRRGVVGRVTDPGDGREYEVECLSESHEESHEGIKRAMKGV